MNSYLLAYLLIGVLFLIHAILTSKEAQKVTERGFFKSIFWFSLYVVFWFPLFVISFIIVIQQGKKENEK